MESRNKAIYLTCTRHKSLQRKHIDVCRQCEWNTTCEPYLAYCDSEPSPENKESLPISQPALKTDLLVEYIRKELRDIKILVESSAFGKYDGPNDVKTAPVVSDNFFEDVKKELLEIRTLIFS
jgi:hypothetical protein